MDRVLIDALKVEASIGIFEWEQRIRQQVVLDLELGTDTRKAAASDDIADAVDYKAVAKRISELAGEGRWGLVERLAEAVAACLREEFGLPWVRVTLRKPGAVTGAAAVGITIERGDE